MCNIQERHLQFPAILGDHSTYSFSNVMLSAVPEGGSVRVPRVPFLDSIGMISCSKIHSPVLPFQSFRSSLLRGCLNSPILVSLSDNPASPQSSNLTFFLASPIFWTCTFSSCDWPHPHLNRIKCAVRRMDEEAVGGLKAIGIGLPRMGTSSI